MRNWLFLLAVLVLLGAVYERFQSDGDTGLPVEHAEKGNAIGTPTSDNAENSPPVNELTFQVEPDQVRKGNLLLVNEEIAVPPNKADAKAVNLFKHKELVDGFGLLDNSIRLSPELAKAFTTMVKHAAVDGVKNFLISSGYRSDQEQQALYEQLGPEIAAVPGHSEHSLGLALDIGSTTGQMKDAPEGIWLKQNAWKYGFIVRYPEDKTEITGVIHEPWHIRYVGLPHSAIMQENHWAFEEYLVHLKERKSMTAIVEGKTYIVYYFPVASNTTLRVPVVGNYELSGNNTDGVIVTVFDIVN
ncbi:M15 family metallopeptidase [Paenibacillus lignilyticus]|uniref:M15 family metallopeptidase n=1 Tax=Paenibacillus lignilyticus TaxID=1172615 RepID=A0ABS5CAR2_9BACL|nr:M15 family metallopeptidase [Paenibacillus lignilyticus]MBP3963083.1 M15 family metallopeptidase [Paenibacillus lignilyticus]